MAFQFQEPRSRADHKDYATITSEKTNNGRRGMRVTFSEEFMHDYGIKIGSRVLLGFDDDSGLYGVIDNTAQGKGIKVIPCNPNTNSTKSAGKIIRGHAKQTILDDGVLPDPEGRMSFSAKMVNRIDSVIVFNPVYEE